MDQKRKLYHVLAEYLQTQPWLSIKDDYFIAVEMPETKEMYYVTMNEIEEEPFTIEFNIMKGALGLEYIRKDLDKKSKTFDPIERGHFISIFFEKDHEGWREDYSLHFEGQSYEVYERFGEPILYNKIKGGTSFPLEESIVSDLVQVFEGLKAIPIKNLKRTKKFNENTSFETLFKKDGSWQREKRKVRVDYETVKYSDLEVYPLIKNNEQFNEVWFILSYYEHTLVDEDPSQGFKPSFFEAGIHLLAPEGHPINFNGFSGPSEELKTAKETIIETIKTFEMRPKHMIISIKSLYEGLRDFLKALGIQGIYEPEDQTIEAFIEAYLLDEDFLDDYLDEEEFSNILMLHFLEAKGITPEALDNFSEEKVESLLKELETIVESLMASCDKELLTNPALEDLTEEEMTDFLVDYVITGIDNQVKP